MKPEIIERKNAFIRVPEIDKEKCTYCRKCAEACEFNAIAILPENFMLFKELCHGCGLCAMVCPENAITEKNREIGVIEKGKTDGIGRGGHRRMNLQKTKKGGRYK